MKIEVVHGVWDPPWTLRNLARNLPLSILMIGNNSLKQLAFGARANSPVPIVQSKAMQLDQHPGENRWIRARAS